MMTCTAHPPTPPRVSERRPEAPSRGDGPTTRPADADTFERLLRRKSGDDDDAGCGDQESSGNESPPPPPTPDAPTPAPALRAVALSASPLLAAAELPPAVVAAASRSALQGEAPTGAAALRGDKPEATFQVSLQESPGVQVELRATRGAVTATGFVQAPSWNLSVGSPALNRATLSRHVARLDERLRAKGITPGHVRIEEAEDEAP